MAAIEAPGMIARILLIGKLSSAALPFQSYFVFSHVFYMECGQALGNRLFLAAKAMLIRQRSTSRLYCRGWNSFPLPKSSVAGRNGRISVQGASLYDQRV